jgi:membrane protein
VLGWVGLADVTGAGTLLRLIALSVAVAADGLIFFILFTTLAGTKATWRQLLRGCLFGAIGFEVLKLVGALLVAHTVRNPVYASFAVIAGLAVWINLSSRFILFSAAWTATRRVVLKADAPQPEDPEAKESEPKESEAKESEPEESGPEAPRSPRES